MKTRVEEVNSDTFFQENDIRCLKNISKFEFYPLSQHSLAC